MNKVRLSSWALLAFCAVWACGGEVQREGGSEQAGGSGGDDGPFAATKTGPCKPGTAPTPGASCPWIAKERCYPTKEAACACICPTDRESICTSASASDLRAVKVNCF
jgi:hypothetical protein